MTREIQSYPQCTEAMAADLDRLETRLTNIRHEADAYKRQRDKLADALRMTLGPLQDHQNLNRSLAASVAYREAVAALSDIDK